MHKPSLAVCLLALLTFSVPALAEAPGSTGAPGGGAPGVSGSPSGAAAGTAAAPGEQKGPQGGPQGGAGFPPLPPEKLAEVKVQIAKNIDTLIEGLQKRKACIEAAASAEALHACGGLPRPVSMRRDGLHAGGQPQPAPQ